MSDDRSLEDEMNKELDRIDKEAGKSDDNGDPIGAVFDAAQRRLEDDVAGRLALVFAFVLIAIGNMAFNMLQQEKVVTLESIVLMSLAAVLYVLFRLFIQVYNYAGLKLQNSAVELDTKELEVKRNEMKLEIERLERKHELQRQDLLFEKTQERADRKLTQDLELRAPFFQDAQKGLMGLFARDDIVSTLQAPPALMEAVARLDDTLLKRSEMDLTFADMTKKITYLTECTDKIHRKQQENAELINIFVQKEAILVVKWQETETRMANMEKGIEKLSNAVDNIMKLLIEQNGIIIPIKEETATEEPLEGGAETTVTVKEEKEEDEEGILSPPPLD